VSLNFHPPPVLSDEFTSDRAVRNPTFEGAEHGLCRTVPVEIFYPSIEADEGLGSGYYVLAKAICSACPVKMGCRSYALSRPEYWGVWGGLTPSERRSIRLRRD
jgi:WhiB family redox-sensing transcriptional regulator